MDILDFLYNTAAGRPILSFFIKRPVSLLAGAFLDSPISRFFIGPFVRKNNIRTRDYILDDIASFNDFFCRKIKKDLRPVDMEAGSLISPCDGALSVYRIDDDTVLKVKNSAFTVRRMLRDKKLAGDLAGGYALVFRLGVQNYHRYIYFDSGKKYKNRRINGVYHTVKEEALLRRPVFIENAREYTVIDTDHFGRCVQMEVGAMLVGRIVNDVQGACKVKRGQEKGHFEYGGSTVILLLKKDAAFLRDDITAVMGGKSEIPVVMGEKIGCCIDTR
ncbi:MAG: phosphatidylserine decarboxylase [Lachnospiraceae bacterium]|nr:phosphatidylserine decarboxylase [Lachnospiraceae bacterium]